MRIRRKVKRSGRRRTFTLQMYDAVVLSGAASFEEEAKRLDTCAHTINDLLALPAGSCSIRHDDNGYHCYIRPEGNRMLLVQPRYESALRWPPFEVQLWCEAVADEWLEASGLPTRAGNRLPRPVETRAREATVSLSPRGRDGQT